MPNSLLTVNQLTREALRVLHQKLTFVGSINRQYDDSFAKSGAKIGSDLRIRLPNEYVTRTGAALSAQDTAEQSTTLSVSTQRGVDLTFTSAELTLSLDDFSKRIIQPAMSVLAATIEADALSMMSDVYNVVRNNGSALTFARVLQGRKSLNDALAPMDDNRTALLNTQDNVDLVDALKGLFQDSSAIKSQYRDGVMGRTGGFEFAESTYLPTITSGTTVSGSTAYLTTAIVSGGTVGNSVIPVSGATTTFVAGDIIQISGVFRVHPETKANTGVLQTFVVTSAFAGGTGNLAVSPPVYSATTGAAAGRRNVSAQIPAGAQIIKMTGDSGYVMRPSLTYHKDAFTFATADLVMPEGVDFASRQVFDGISMRIVRQYTISDDSMPCRIDVLYGYKTLRAQLAARLHSN
jgi:hypothetical protein